MFLFLVLCFSIVILNFLEFLVVMKLNCSILIWIFKILLLLLLFLLFFRRNTILPSVQFLCFASLTSSFLIFVCLSFFHFSLNGFVESLILDVYNIFKCQALNSSWFFFFVFETLVELWWYLKLWMQLEEHSWMQTNWDGYLHFILFGWFRYFAVAFVSSLVLLAWDLWYV